MRNTVRMETGVQIIRGSSLEPKSFLKYFENRDNSYYLKVRLVDQKKKTKKKKKKKKKKNPRTNEEHTKKRAGLWEVIFYSHFLHREKIGKKKNLSHNR